MRAGTRRSLLALLTTTILLAGCGTASPSRTPSSPGATHGSTSLTPLLPQASASPTAQPSPSVSPATPSAVSALQWVEHGSLSGGNPSVAVGFDGGYVAAGDSSTGPTAWFSADGRSWEAVTLESPVPGAGVRGIASRGSSVVIVGGYEEPCEAVRGNDTGSGPGCPWSPISWLTTDGLHWRSSLPLGGDPLDSPEHWQGGGFSSVWAVPGGWEATLYYWHAEWQGEQDIWSSPDGLAWTRAATLDAVDERGALADAIGQRLMWSDEWCSDGQPCTSRTVLATSADGRGWLESPVPLGMSWVEVGVAPPWAGAPWVVGGHSCSILDGREVCGRALWTSFDLQQWSLASSSDQDLGASYWGLVTWRDGFVALGAGGSLPWSAESWVSDSGVHWAPIRETPQVSLLASGPGGVLAIGGPSVYRLQ